MLVRVIDLNKIDSIPNIVKATLKTNKEEQIVSLKNDGRNNGNG
jgi:hypothetical protein